MPLVPFCYLAATPGKKTFAKGVLSNGHEILIMPNGEFEDGIKRYTVLIDSESKIEKKIYKKLLELTEEEPENNEDDLPF